MDTEQQLYDAHRLLNTSGAGTYGVQSVAQVSLRAAYAVVRNWWESKGTLSVCVVREVYGRLEVDTDYTRPWIDRARIPEDWRGNTKPAVAEYMPAAPPPSAIKAAERELAAIDPIFEDPEAEYKAEASRLPWNLGPVEGACGACGAADVQPDPDDRDRTPSGRIANHRCAECGRAWPGTRQATLQDWHLRFRSPQ